MTKQIGPLSENKALKSNWPTNGTLYSAKKRITMHSQCCLLLSGKYIFQDLHLFIKDGRQMAKSVGEKWKRTFYLDEQFGQKIWRQWI